MTTIGSVRPSVRVFFEIAKTRVPTSVGEREARGGGRGRCRAWRGVEGGDEEEGDTSDVWRDQTCLTGPFFQKGQ